ncbi:unnamed protein product [Malus baccata var. baccata]
MMADSALESTKGWEGEGSREGKAYAELICDIGGLVREKCCIEFNSWKMVPVDVKNFMVVWDVDETDEKQRKYVDELFKKKFWDWKFDV